MVHLLQSRADLPLRSSPIGLASTEHGQWVSIHSFFLRSLSQQHMGPC